MTEQSAPSAAYPLFDPRAGATIGESFGPSTVSVAVRAGERKLAAEAGARALTSADLSDRMNMQAALAEELELPVLEEDAVAILPGAVAGKRVFDVIVGGSLAVATLPIQVVVLALSAVSFKAWPIFRQTRVGKDGEYFTFRKIRSLPASAPTDATKHELGSVQNSRVGRLLRRTHVDETIQLWSVVTGKLSLVGPRPEMVSLSDRYDPQFVRARTAVRPGVTGVWQVSEASDGLIGEAPEFDEYYVQERSWSLEVKVLTATASKMVLGRTSNLLP